jgi:hypothetical protein
VAAGLALLFSVAGRKSGATDKAQALRALPSLATGQPAGWKLFCERLSIPPFARWAGLPGLHRLQRVLALGENVAFSPAAMLRWLNRTRGAGESEIQQLALTPEGCAAGMEMIFRKRVEWWGG